MSFDPALYHGHFVAEFIEPAEPRWVMFASAYDHSSTPLGPDRYYALRIDSAGGAELHLSERNGYTGEQELLLVVRGQAVIGDLRADSFTIRITDPVFELVQVGPGVEAHIERFRAGRPWPVRRHEDV